MPPSFFDLIRGGLGILSGEELQGMARNTMEYEIDLERREYAKEKQAEFKAWLRPAEWYPAPTIVNARWE